MSTTLTCAIISNYLPHHSDQIVEHGRQGKLLDKCESSYIMKKPLGIYGHRPKRKLFHSLISNHISHQPLEEISESESVAPYPVWKRQQKNICHLAGITEERFDILKLIKEAWEKKSSNPQSISDKAIRVVCELPPWKNLEKQPFLDKLNNELRIRHKIITDFYFKFHNDVMFDAEEFLIAETGRNIEDMNKLLQELVIRAMRTIQVEWPLSVGRILLDEGDSWIPNVVDNTCISYFDTVAATMTRTLYNVLKENIQRIVNCFEETNEARANLVIILEENSNINYLSNMVEEILKLSRVVRPEHKLYPDLFPEKWIDVKSWFTLPAEMLLTNQNPFVESSAKLNEIEEDIKQYKQCPDDMTLFEKLAITIAQLRTDVLSRKTQVNMKNVLFDSSRIKQKLLHNIEKLEDSIKQTAEQYQLDKNADIRQGFIRCCSLIFNVDVISQLSHFAEVKAHLPIIKEQISQVHQIYDIILKHFVLSDNSIRDYMEVSRLGWKLEKLTEFVWENIENERDWITTQVSEQTDIHAYESSLCEKVLLSTLSKLRSSLQVNESQAINAKLQTVLEKIQILYEADQPLTVRRVLLNVPHPTISLEKLKILAEFFTDLTSLHFNVLLHDDTWMRARVLDVDYGEISVKTEELNELSSAIQKRISTIEDNRFIGLAASVVEKIEETLSQFSSLLPVITALTNQGMKEKHWQEILKDIGPHDEIKGNPMVKELLEMNLTQNADKFQQISIVAEKELIIEQTISKMKEQWEGVTFDSHEKNLMSDILHSQLISHIIRTQQLLSSQYGYSAMDQLKGWMDILQQINTFIELYAQCLDRWRRIEGVFSTEDIAYQMPSEFRIFKKIIIIWQNINSRISQCKTILSDIEWMKITNKEMNGLKDEFALMEGGFHGYLNKKRITFPRLFLLSDNQLLDLLSRARDPLAVMPYIPLLFARIQSFQLNKKGEIESIQTENGDIIMLTNTVNINISKRHMEKWMNELDREMKNTVRMSLKKMIEEHELELVSIEKFMAHFQQMIDLYYKTAMSYQIENSIRNNTLKILLEQLETFVYKTQENLARDRSRDYIVEHIGHYFMNSIKLVKKLMKKKVRFTDNEKWIEQIRYYWHMDHLFIRVWNISVRYDYQLIDRLTPLIDIKQLSHLLRTAMLQNRFGFGMNLHGISSTLLLQLAEALGRPVVRIFEETRNNMLIIHGSMLLGALLIYEKNLGNLTIKTTKDSVLAHQKGNFKYVLGTELTINPSFMFMNTFKNSRLNWAVRGYNRSDRLNNVDYLMDKLKLYRLDEWEKIAARLTSICSVLSWFDIFFLNIVINDIIMELLILKKEEYLRPEMDLLDTALQLHLVPLLSNKIDEQIIPMLGKNYTDKEAKARELLRLLTTHHVLIVFGDSLSGKTRTIYAAKQMESLVEINIVSVSPRWIELRKFIENFQNKNESAITWLHIDGYIDEDSMKFLTSILEQGFIIPNDGLPLPILKNLRFIIETDQIPANLSSRVPVLVIEDQSVPQLENITLTNLTRLTTLLRELEISEEDGKWIKLKISSLLSHDFMLGDSERFAHITTITLLSWISEAKLYNAMKTTNCGIDFTSSIDQLYSDLKLLDDSKSTDLTSYLLYRIQSAELCIRAGLYPFLFGPMSQLMRTYNEYLYDHLVKSRWNIIPLAISSDTNLEEIMDYIAAGKSLLINDDDETENHLVVWMFGFESANIDIIEFVRKNNQGKVLFILSSSKNIECFPKRLARHVFPIHIQGNHFKVQFATRKILHQISEKGVEHRKLDIHLAMYQEYAKSHNRKSDIEKSAKAIDQSNTVDANQMQADIPEIINVLRPMDTTYAETQTNYLRMIYMEPGCSIVIDDYIEEMIYLAKDAAPQGNVDLLHFSAKRSSTGDDWTKFLESALRQIVFDERLTVILITIDAAVESIGTSMIICDLCSLLAYNCIPCRLVNQQFLSEFSERLSVQGDGIWMVIMKKLMNCLRICFIAKEDGLELMNLSVEGREIVNHSFFYRTPQRNDEMYLQSMRLFLKQSKIFVEKQVNLICDKLLEASKLETNQLSYQNLINTTRTVIYLAKKKEDNIEITMSRYMKGTEKLRRAQEQLILLQEELATLQPQLFNTSIQTSVLMSTIEKETIEVENAREVVAANEFKANEAATKAQALKAESEADLAAAIPALDAAVESLETMTQSDVSTLKTMRFPPYGVRLCMEAVCIILGEPPAKIPNPMGEATEDYWITGQKLLSDIHFLTKIRNFPRDQVSKKTMLLIREKYLSKEEFEPENVKQCSLAAEGLCLWVKAIDLYNKISKIVEPKKEKLRKAEILVKQHMKQLEIKRRALQKVTEKLQSLSDQFSQMSQRKQELQTQITSCEGRMERAERLVMALGGEKNKWKEKMTTINADRESLVSWSILTALSIQIFSDKLLDERQKRLEYYRNVLFPNYKEFIDQRNEAIIQLCETPMLLYNNQGKCKQFLEVTQKSLRIIRGEDATPEIILDTIHDGSSLLIEEISAENIDSLLSSETIQIFRKENSLVTVNGDIHTTVVPGYRIFFTLPIGDPFDIRPKNNRVVSLNMDLSREELRSLITKTMGEAIWPSTLQAYTQLDKDIQIDQIKLENMESEMLDMLGRSQDLDDERAMELLAETHVLLQRIEEKKKDLEMQSNNLLETTKRFDSLINWAVQVIYFIRRIQLIDRFVYFTTGRLIAITGTKLHDSSEEVNQAILDKMKNQLAELFTKEVEVCCDADNRILLEYILRKPIASTDDIVLLQKELQNINKNILFQDRNDFKELGEFVWNCDASIPILISCDYECMALLHYLTDCSKKVPVEQYSVLPNTKQIVVSHIEKPIWTVVHICNWLEDKKIIEEIQNALIISKPHPNFRLIITVEYNDLTDQICQRYSQKYLLSSKVSFYQNVNRVLSLSHVQTYYFNMKASCRVQLLRLITFHYSIISRSQFGFVGFCQNPRIDLSHLFTAMKFFHECCQINNLDSQPISVIEKMIISPIYLSLFEYSSDINTVKTMMKWIFDCGISKQLDKQLAQLLGNMNNIENFLNHIRSANGILLSGLNPSVVMDYQKQSERKLSNKLFRILGKNEENSPRIKKPASFSSTSMPDELSVRSCIELELKITENKKSREYLVGLLKQETISSIDVTHLHDVIPLSRCILYQYAIQQKLQICEVELTAEFIVSARKPGNDNKLFVDLINCTLYGCCLEGNELVESSNVSESVHVTIRLSARKKLQSSKPRPSIPFISSNNMETIAQIPISSTLPISHFILRGAKVISCNHIGEINV